MVKKKKELIELKNEKTVNLIKLSDKSLNTIAKESNMSLKELQSLIDGYDRSLELKLDYDKKERKDIKDLFLDVEKGLKNLMEEAKSVNLPERSYKEYAQVFDGQKWVGSPKKLGSKSFITQKDINI
jgi:hypothetical protein